MMQAKVMFDDKISEIELLNNADINDSDEKTYFKVIILLLCAKLEKFVKDSANEYMQEIFNLKVKKKNLPEKLVLEVIKNELAGINAVQIESILSNDRVIKKVKNLALAWDENYILQNIDDDFSISVSGNGTNALRCCYKKIGFPNFFDNIKDYEQTDEIAGIFSSTTYSVVDYLNKIIKIRHEIIHDDATPNITKQEIELYVNILKYFVEQVDAILTNTLVTYQ